MHQCRIYAQKFKEAADLSDPDIYQRVLAEATEAAFHSAYDPEIGFAAKFNDGSALVALIRDGEIHQFADIKEEGQDMLDYVFRLISARQKQPTVSMNPSESHH